MARSSSKSLSSILLLILMSILIYAAFNLPLIFKEQFLKIEDIIEKNAEDALGKNFSIGKIGFFPYGELILYDVKIYDKTQGISYAEAKRCAVRFKLWPLFINKAIVVTDVEVKAPLLYPAFKKLRVSKKETIIGGYRLEIDRYLFIKLGSGKAVLVNKDSGSDEIRFAFWARFTGENGFYSEGWVDLDRYSLGEYLLNDVFFFDFIDKIGYKLKCSLEDNDTLSVDELVLDFEQFKLGAKGRIEDFSKNPIVNIEVGLKDLYFQDKIYLRSKLLIASIRNFIMQIKGALLKPHFAVRLDNLSSRLSYLPATLKIDNFYCNLKLSKDELLIEECSCFLNNLPVGLECRLSKTLSPNIELNVVSYPGQISSLRPLNPLSFGFSFSGDKKEDLIKGNVSLEIEKLVSLNPRKTHYMKLGITELACKFSEGLVFTDTGKNVSPLFIEAKDINYEANMPRQDTILNFGNLTASLYPQGTRFYFSDLNLSGYGGLLKSRGFLGIEALFPRFFFDCEFNGLNVPELLRILHLDYELGGTLSGRAIFDTKAFSWLVGGLTIQDGYMKDLTLLNLIADFLSIPSISDIYFDEFSSNFSISTKGEQFILNSLRLHSPNIYLEADLTLKDRQKIKGNILARLSNNILRESFKMRLLFLLMGENLPYADFEFEIGGLLKSPHVKWLDTNFRKKVMRYLSESGQKAMEKEVEKAIKPLLESNE